MKDYLIDALENIKLEIQTSPDVSQVVEKIDKSISVANSGQMIQALKVLKGDAL